MDAEFALKHSAEFRRCLLECDVTKLLQLHRLIAPYSPGMSAAEAAVTMHMARVETKNFPLKVRQYSVEWLADQGYSKIDGGWQRIDALEKKVFAEAVGISSSTASGHKLPLNRKIMRGMSDVLLNGIAKGIMEPERHTEIMQKERMRIRFKARV
jgi:hypothetical protein